MTCIKNISRTPRRLIGMNRAMSFLDSFTAAFKNRIQRFEMRQMMRSRWDSGCRKRGDYCVCILESVSLSMFCSASDAMAGVDIYFLTKESLGALYPIRKTTYEICKSTSGFPFRCAKDITDEFENGDALTHIFYI